ncbi:MAG: CCA tRNA nucleotidyltransferase [Candidatus Peregrinibacteria bacterium]|nr:CCA tRNA nucleotidyltransferase [Candidatus Peregrinibacteria bacterium]
MSVSQHIIDDTLRTPQGEDAYTIVEKLTDAGFDTWWVGGCVRDMLLGRIPEDIDIATGALPEEVKVLFPKADMTAAPVGSVRIPLRKRSFEVTTFREDDAASNGRHPEAVVFGTREQDAKRRDITVNAMYWNPISRALFDPFDGEADLKERLIRFIGDPAIRIKHDALRMLRAVRFRATLHGQYHPETYRALQEQAPLVEILSGQRLREELEKMLLCPHPDRALEDLWELGILQRFLPELAECKGIPQPADYHHEGDVWDHTLMITRAFTAEHGIDTRLAALFHDCGKTKTFSLKERIRFDHHASISAELAAQALSRLQMPQRRREKICWVIEHHMMMGSFASMNDERKSHWYYHPWFPELLQVFWLDIAGTDPADFSLYEEIVADEQHFLDSHPRPPKPLLTGEDIMDALGIPPGEEVGKMLQTLYEAQIRGEIATKKEALARMKGLGADRTDSAQRGA